MQLLIIVMLTAIASSTAGYAQEDKKFDECAKVGKLVLMFGQLDHECDKYELTDAGRTAQMNMKAKAIALGGETCFDRGKAEMAQTLSSHSPRLLALSAAGDRKAFQNAKCDAIAYYLRLITRVGEGAVFEEKH